jgi:WhiB family redox-sensing transcriptional regulator
MMPDWNWHAAAACRGEDLYLFFGGEGERLPDRLAREERAKRICGGCPARRACLDYALSANEKAGVWGAMGEDERASERRRRQRRSANSGVPAA